VTCHANKTLALRSPQQIHLLNGHIMNTYNVKNDRQYKVYKTNEMNEITTLN